MLLIISVLGCQRNVSLTNHTYAGIGYKTINYHNHDNHERLEKRWCPFCFTLANILKRYHYIYWKFERDQRDKKTTIVVLTCWRSYKQVDDIVLWNYSDMLLLNYYGRYIWTIRQTLNHTKTCGRKHLKVFECIVTWRLLSKKCFYFGIHLMELQAFFQLWSTVRER